MIKPGEIPQYTGKLEKLEEAHAALKKDAEHIRSTGADVHSHFQGLSAYYKAPEAEQLFATTKPVKDRADTFADDLETVASALADYADEVRPLKTKLEHLKTDAIRFVDEVKDDEDWEYDDDKVGEHQKLRDDINATVAAFWAAERTCYNKIVALWNGPKMVAGDGSKRAHQYGFNADDLKNAKVPWGDPVEQKHHWYDVGHWVKSFAWDGIVVDGVWGTTKGLGTLVGVDGWDAAGQAWKGLAQLGTSLAILTLGGPGAAAFMGLPDDKLPSWLRDSRTAFKETGKALVAWDEWGKNPGRAAGAVTFNALTTVFTGGAGGAAAGAGKAGAVAKAISVAGKAGKVIDPMTYVGKAAGAGLSTVGDIAKSLKGVGKVDIPALPEDAIKLPEGSLKLPDGTVHLPEGASIPEGATRLPDGNVKLPDDVPALPENASKLPTGQGESARYFDGQGNLLDEHGNTLQDFDNAPKEGPLRIDPQHAGADTPRVDSPAKDPALVGAGAGAHTVDNAGHVRLDGSLDDFGRVGENVHTPGNHIGDTPGGFADHAPGRGADGHLPGGNAGNFDHVPHARHAHGGGSHTGGHGDGPGAGGPEGSSSSGRGNAPSSSHSEAPGHGDHGGVTGAGGSDNLGHTGDGAAAPSHQADDGARTADNGRGSEQPQTAEAQKKIIQEQIWKANNNESWFEEYYRSDGHRKSIEATDENGDELPVLAKDSDGDWIPRDSLPSKPSETRINPRPFDRGSVRVDHIDHLDNVSKNRSVASDLTAAEKAVKGHPTHEALQALDHAQQEYAKQLGDVPNNSKISERLGEDAARYHVIPERFPDAVEVQLPKTANGANMFDQLYKLDDGSHLIVEAKAPKSDLIWRKGAGDAQGWMVKQGTKEYVQTIIAEMMGRSSKDVRIATSLLRAMRENKLHYVLVKANENTGTYAGAVLEHFKIN